MIARVREVLADPDRGSEPVALAILAPVMLLLLGLLVIGGRVALASQSIAGVAGNAARDASIARTPAEAVAAATAEAQASLLAQNIHCDPAPQVAVDTAGFSAAPGAAASVRVDITCVVSLSTVGFPGLPGSRTLHDHATSALDPYRSIALGFRNSGGRAVPNRRVEVGRVAS